MVMKLKLLRDMKNNAAQFISIFVIILLGMLIYTGLNSISVGMEVSATTFYQETNLADAFLYGYNFSVSDLNNLKNHPGIEDAELRFQFDVNLKEDSAATLQLNYIDTNTISSMLVTKGINYTPDAKGLWLDESFAKEHKLEVGDTIAYTYEGLEETKEIVGLVMHPEYVFAVKDEAEALPNHKTFGYCFMSKQEFTLAPTLPINQILLKTKLSKQELNSFIEKQSYNQSAVLLLQEDSISVNQFRNEISQMKSVQTIFPVIFLLVAILTILTTMTRITVNQRMQIGILKALGFSNRRIYIHYSAFGFVLSLVGSLIGSLLGIFMLPNVVYNFQKKFYILPHWYRQCEPYVFITVGLCILCCGFCGFYACKKQLEDAAANILRPKVAKLAKLTAIEKSSWWSKLSFDVAWNLRDCMHNKLRSFITIFGIVGCMTLMICGLGMNDTMNHIIQTSYSELNTYETKVTLASNGSVATLEQLRSNSDNQLLQEGAVEVKEKSTLTTVNMQVSSQGDYIKYKDEHGNFFKLPDDGVFITSIIAKDLELKAGDTITFRPYGTTDFIEANITTVIKSPIGQGIFLSSSYYENLGLRFTPTSFVTSQTNLSQSNEFTTIQTKEDMIDNMDEILSMMYVMISIMILAAATLGIVVLYNLGVLSFYEKVRELATLKVLGFQYRRLTSLLQKQNLWLTFLGLILGIPSGFLVLKFMVQFMGDNFDIIPKVSILTYASCCIGILFLSLGVNRFMSRKLKSIDMVSALKSTE